MAKDTDETRLGLAGQREEGVIDGDAEQKARWHYAASEAGPEPQPAAGTERESRHVAPQKARAAAKRGILWYLVRGLSIYFVFNIVYYILWIITLLAGWDDMFDILVEIGRAYVSVIRVASRCVNAVDSAVSALIELWTMFPSFPRVALAFVPVIAGVCCGVYTIVKDKGQAWREVSAVLTAAGFALLTWQISRIYNISGTPHGFLMLVMAVSLPLVYIFRSYSLTALYCAFHLRFIYYIVFDRAGWVDGGFLHFLGIAPFIIYYIFFRKPADKRTVGMRYICLMPLIYLLVYLGLGSALALNLFAATGLLYTAGLYYDETDTRSGMSPRMDSEMSLWPASLWKWILIIFMPWAWIIWLAKRRSPWTGAGGLSIAVLLAIVIIWPGFLPAGSMYPPGLVPAGHRLSVLWLVLFAAQVFIAARLPTPLKIAIIIAILTQIFCYLFGVKPENAAWAAGAALLLAGAAALAEGLKGNNRLKANIGLFQMMAVSIAVDFTGQTGGAGSLNSSVSAVIFVAFIVINIKMSRNFRGEDTSVPEKVEEYGDVWK